ncbi:L-lactate dehydrogenase [bioreactor metagenome]|uniref:L-lactate dehydrogenase n=1 Tax=bioreactor metagenome TaxID=1076179 RepID=A0A645G2A9_9ZZZZ
MLGEHGDSSVIPWSLTAISGMKMEIYCDNIKKTHGFQGDTELQQIEAEVRSSGAKVIELKNATYYAIAMSVRYLCECILRNTSCVLTVSGLIQGQFGIHDVALSLPFVIDSQGIKQALEPPLNEEENVRVEVSLPDRLEAPLETGDRVGQLTYYTGDTCIGQVDLVCGRSVRRDAVAANPWLSRILDFFSRKKGDTFLSVFYSQTLPFS